MSPPPTPPVVVWPSDVGASASLAQVGGKGLRLISLATYGIEDLVPTFFIITSGAFHKMIARPDIAHIIEAILSGDELSDAAGREQFSETDRNAISGVTLADDVTEPIFAAFQRLPLSSSGGVAVRSSGIAEDGSTHSFAGQFDSLLGITNQNDLLAAVKSCWASAFSARSIAYRQHHGLSMDDISMAVIVQIMVVGEVSGVIFTRTGSSPAPYTLISATWGLCEGVVSGLVATDEYSISHADESIHTVIGDKHKKVMLSSGDGGATAMVSVPREQQNSPSLTEAQAVQLHHLGQTIETSQGGPQDIEWTIRGDHIWVVQTRPITGVPQGSGNDAQIVWDNSNIVESYNGVTMPLTFSYIKFAYSVAYRQSCRVAGIPEANITHNADNFENLLGSIRGRVYYNLKAWFTLLALFPGFKKTSTYMEQMLGLTESAKILTQRPRRTLFQNIRLGYRMLYNYIFIGSMVRRFESHFARVSRDFYRIDLDQLALGQIADLYNDMVGKLLYHWQAPLITDFLVMLFHGRVVELTKKWEVDASGDISAELLSGGQPGASMAVTLKLLGIADFIRADAALMELLMATPAEQCHNVIARTASARQLAQLADQYLQEYGCRCMNELKLEEPTLKDRPDRFYRLLKSYLSQADLSVSALHHRERDRYAAARRRLNHRLPGSFKRFIYLRAVRQARRHINNRELMRLRRTQGQDMLRRIFNSMGSELVQQQVLADQGDVYLLQLRELFGYVDGSVSGDEIGEIISDRRKEYEHYLEEDDPPARLVTHSANGHLYESSATLNDAVAGEALKGIPITGGTVSGAVRVIHSLADDLDLEEKILVIKQADPGWVHLFPAIRGLLVERGSALSHAAIIARELGLPTIVNIPGLTHQVKDGDQVEMDAAQGTLRVISNDR